MLLHARPHGREWGSLTRVRRDTRRTKGPVSDESNPLDHLPDPKTRSQVLAVPRGREIHLQLREEATKTGLLSRDPRSARHLAAEITAAVVRSSQVMASQVAQGTLPRWQRLILFSVVTFSSTFPKVRSPGRFVLLQGLCGLRVTCSSFLC